jgi:hypothetical protein
MQIIVVQYLVVKPLFSAFAYCIKIETNEPSSIPEKNKKEIMQVPSCNTSFLSFCILY